MANVLIKSGSYRNAPIENTVFPLVKGATEGNKGLFLTVDASTVMPGRDRIRVLVNSAADYEIVGSEETMEIAAVPTQPKIEETDEQVMARIGERFDIMDSMTQAVVEGVVRSMIVVGPPGVGKSFGITKKLAEANLFNLMAGEIRYDVVKGATTALGLYAKLYEFSREGDVLVFDDCDSILMDELSLNILKAALDTNKKRYIHWNSDSKLLQREGIPNKFEFKGACIFITNIKFETIRSAKLRDHLSALESRSHYIDLTMNTMRDKILRIKQIAETGELFKEYRFENGEEQEILDFMNDNQNRLREMSMRCAVKLADLRKTMPEKWKRTAEITLMKNAF
jgi:hypothetical protein